MKKRLILLITLAMLLGLCACNAPVETPATTTEATTAPTEPAVDYSPYLCPWTENVVEKAKADGKIHYYFMAGEGIHISLNQQNVDKWGDSCLVVFPDGKTMLIDGGPTNYGPVLVRNLQQMGITHLDYMLVTHPHSDHQNGVFAEANIEEGVLGKIGISQVYHRGSPTTSNEKNRLVDIVCEERNIPLEIVEQGDVLQFGDVTMQVLWPMIGTSTFEVASGDINDKSIVVRFDYQEHSSLFAADLYYAGEDFMMKMNKPELLDVDFLKVPHHGHGTSSSTAFLAAASPELAVAMGRVPIPANLRKIFAGMNINLLYDLINGYIHVAADKDGSLTYEHTRQNDPSEELNTPSASLKPAS